MTIGILTFHRALNYGAVLQCYGLNATLKSMGHEVDVIDYRPKYVERYRHIIPWYEIRQAKGFLIKFKIFISSIFNIFSTIDANRRFDDFLNKHFSFSNRVHNAKDISQKYDIIFLGSDQIWSPRICWGFDPIFWGQSLHGSAKLVTYAASMGDEHKNLSKREWKLIRQRLLDFDRISVREQPLQYDLQKKINIKSVVAVDPTLLLDKSVYEEMAIRPKNALDNYVLVFSLAPTKNLQEFSEMVASQTNSSIVSISAKKTSIFSYKNQHKNIELCPTIEEFLGLFKYARCIVTVSFHGTMFSVIFRKDFYSLRNFAQGREQFFLDTIGLGHRLVSTDIEAMANFHYESVDYNPIEEKLTALQSSSLDYIKDALKQ